MKRTKTQKGITLVALIITIIVLLILAVVAIQAVQGDGIISHAKNARDEYEQAQAEEIGILSGYEIELSKKSPTSFSDEMASTKFEKTTFVKDGKGKIFVVPAGYTIVKDATTANTVEVDKGVVITDGRSEFVWVPVENINGMAKVTSGTDVNGRINYQGILYKFTSTGATEMTKYGHREPDVVTGVDPSTVDSASGSSHDAVESNLTRVLEGGYAKTKTATSFKNQLQAEYNSMVESVAKYGGFYVGRYEMSMNGTTAQSKSGEISLDGRSNENNWYGLYAKAKTYTNTENSVVSSMIYGSQYDAMMRWLQSNGIDVTSKTPTDTTGIIASKNETRVTGSESKDKLNNVYDLLGNIFEWTQESSSTYSRVRRGGIFYSSDAPNNRQDHNPTNTSRDNGSRLTLYIR